jgi:hypothetical protein
MEKPLAPVEPTLGLGVRSDTGDKIRGRHAEDSAQRLAVDSSRVDRRLHRLGDLGVGAANLARFNEVGVNRRGIERGRHFDVTDSEHE